MSDRPPTAPDRPADRAAGAVQGDDPVRILHLEDSPDDAELIALHLREAGLAIEVRRIDTRQAFEEALRSFRPDIVLADMRLPAFDGREALAMARAHDPALPVIMVTGALVDEEAIALLRAGANDYILKDRLGRLGMAMGQALSSAKELRARKAAEAALKDAEERFRLVVESAPDAIFIEADNHFIYANQATAELFGAADAGELVGTTLNGRIVVKDEGAAPRAAGDIGAGPPRRSEEIYLRLDGTPIEVEVSSVPFRYGGRAGTLVFAQDITSRKAAESRISFLAYHDGLTGLPNRELLYDRLSVAISQRRRRNGRLALLILDLDDFKAVNDRYGHEAGDELLKVVADRLVAGVRSVDTVARLGGDEFAIILSEIDLPLDATNVAEKLIRSMRQPIALRGAGEVTIGLSVGIAIGPENGDEIDRLLSAADFAMYRSKSRGKNRYSFFDGHPRTGDIGRSWIDINDDYLVGFEPVDEEHRGLAAALNELNNALKRQAPKAEVARRMNAFLSLTRAHFAAEELLMQESGFPETAQHSLEHRGLEADAERLAASVINGRESANLLAIKDWLLDHIQQSDKALGAFLAARRPG